MKNTSAGYEPETATVPAVISPYQNNARSGGVPARGEWQ